MTRRALAPGTPRIAIAIVFGLLAVSPPFVSSFLQALLTQAVIYAILAMSLDVVLGYIGLASLGHAAYLVSARTASASWRPGTGPVSGSP